jgi:hypothetical protein
MNFINIIKNLIMQHKKATVITVVAIVVFIIITLLLTVFRPYVTNTGTIYIIVAPNDASIIIDNKEYTNGEHTISAGDYSIEVARDEFVSQTTDFVVEVGKSTILTIALQPIDSSNTWYVDNPEDDTIYTQVADQNAEVAQAKFVEKFPIMSYVPYIEKSDNPLQNNRYKIDVIHDYETDSLSLKITLNTCSDYSAEVYKQAALDWLNSLDVDLGQYEIEYTTFCG